jgi:PAS domain S-box-containing protein
MRNVLEKLLANLSARGAARAAAGANDSGRPASPPILYGAEIEFEHRATKTPLSEGHFRRLVDGIQDYAVLLLDPEGSILSWNTGAQRIHGYASNEIIGQHFSRLYPREDVAAEKPARALESAALAGRYEEESWRARKDGSLFWANAVVAALREESGKVVGFSKVTRDLTERKRAEEDARRLLKEEAGRRAAEASADAARIALRDEQLQREQLRVTLTSIGDGVIVTNADARVTFLNRVAETLTGWSATEAAGHPVDEIFAIKHEETRAAAENPVARALREGVAVGLAENMLLVRRDGHEISIENAAVPIQIDAGAITGAVLVFRDVTMARRALETRLHLASIVDSSDEAIICGNLDGIILSWNKGAERLYGYKAEEIVGRSIAPLLPPDRPDESRMLSERIRRGERVERFETVRVRKDGSHADVSLTISPIRNASGRVTGGSGIAREITQRTVIAPDNTRVFEEMKQADRRKDEWIAMLAHELRNPLAPMRNALHILSRAYADPDEVLHARRIAERQMRQLARLVDDLLDLSRIMRSRIELRKERVGLAGVVARGIETVRTKIDAAGHELILSMPDEVLELNADPDRLSQVVANLLDNAAKFSGRVARIWLKLERDGNDAVLRVRDEGIGMRADFATRVFEPFVQADQSLERSRGGLGIGLTIVRKLVELHGGTISAHSAGLGQGCELVVRLPGVRASADESARPLAAAGAAAGAGGATRRVLVVDDNIDAAESTAMILRMAGHSVQLAYDGPEVLRVVDEALPDVIVLDIAMPGMNGYEIAKKLRERNAPGRPLLIALTGYGQDSDRRRASDAGFDHHLTKPVDPAALQTLIASA